MATAADPVRFLQAGTESAFLEWWTGSQLPVVAEVGISAKRELRQHEWVCSTGAYQACEQE